MMTSSFQPTAALIVIGNEVLSGRTQDLNINYVAKTLGEIGIPLKEVRIIPDKESTIIDAVNHYRTHYTYVFTTGGIGPTHDDITAASIAKAFGTKLEHHPEAVKILKDHYDPSMLNEIRLRMALIPVGATLIDNPSSKAPGFKIENVYVMAGVPKIMQAMLDGVKHALKGGPLVLSETISCLIPEGEFANHLEEIQKTFPDTEIGSYPYFKSGKSGVSLVIRTTNPEALTKATSAIKKMVEELGG